MITLRRAPMTCRCSNEKSKKVFQDFHKKRTDTVKKNANHIAAISQQDMAEVNSFLKELDELHKAQFEGLKDIIRKHQAKKEREGQKEDTEKTVEVDEVVVEADNIFLKKN